MTKVAGYEECGEGDRLRNEEGVSIEMKKIRGAELVMEMYAGASLRNVEDDKSQI